METTLPPVLRAGGKPQRQQDGDAGAPGEHVGIGKDGFQPLPLQGVAAEICAQRAGHAQQTVVQPAGGHHVDAAQSGKRAADLQHRGTAPPRVPFPLRLTAHQQQSHGGGCRHLQELEQREFPAGRVQGGYAVHEHVCAQQQGGQRHAPRQQTAAYHHTHQHRQYQQQRNELVVPVLHQARYEKIDNGEHRHEPRVPQFLPQLGGGSLALMIVFSCHLEPPLYDVPFSIPFFPSPVNHYSTGNFPFAPRRGDLQKPAPPSIIYGSPRKEVSPCHRSPSGHWKPR